MWAPDRRVRDCPQRRLVSVEPSSLSLWVEACCHMFWQISDVVPVYAMKACMGNRGIAPHILNLGSRWRWVVKFTPISALPLGKSPRYPLKRRLGGLDPVRKIWRREKSLTPTGICISDSPYHGHHTSWSIPVVTNVLGLQKIVSRILELNRNPQDTPALRPSVFELEYIGNWS